MAFYLTERKRFILNKLVDGAPGAPAMFEIPDEQNIKPDRELVPCDSNGVPLGPVQPPKPPDPETIQPTRDVPEEAKQAFANRRK